MIHFRAWLLLCAVAVTLLDSASAQSCPSLSIDPCTDGNVCYWNGASCNYAPASGCTAYVTDAACPSGCYWDGMNGVCLEGSAPPPPSCASSGAFACPIASCYSDGISTCSDDTCLSHDPDDCWSWPGCSLDPYGTCRHTFPPSSLSCSSYFSIYACPPQQCMLNGALDCIKSCSWYSDSTSCASPDAPLVCDWDGSTCNVACSTLTLQTDCETQSYCEFDTSSGQCTFVPPPCSSYTSDTTCPPATCNWDGGSCADGPPCDTITTSDMCSASNYCHWDGSICQRWPCEYWSNGQRMSYRLPRRRNFYMCGWICSFFI